MATPKTASPQEKALKSIRNRNIAAAERSLRLIRDAADQGLAILAEKKTPESSISASVNKYAEALATLRVLDALADGSLEAAEEAPSALEIRDGQLQADLAQFVPFVQEELARAGIEPAEDSPIARLAAIAFPYGEAPWEPPAQDGSPDE